MWAMMQKFRICAGAVKVWSAKLLMGISWSAVGAGAQPSGYRPATAATQSRPFPRHRHAGECVPAVGAQTFVTVRAARGPAAEEPLAARPAGPAVRPTVPPADPTAHPVALAARPVVAGVLFAAVVAAVAVLLEVAVPAAGSPVSSGAEAAAVPAGSPPAALA
jgi:hypothetical protein